MRSKPMDQSGPTPYRQPRAVTSLARRRGATLLVALGFGLVVLLACAATALAGPMLQTGTWVTDGTVDAVAPGPGGITYVGGDFNQIGPYTGSSSLCRARAAPSCRATTP